MSEDQIGAIVTLLSKLALLALGIVAVLMPKKLNSAQINQVSKHKDWLNLRIKSELSKSYMIPFTRFIGIFMVSIVLYSFYF